MARRYIGSIIKSTATGPDFLSTGFTEPRRSGIWGLEELAYYNADNTWYTWGPTNTATTFSTADAGSYSFASQAIGNAAPDKFVFVGVFANASSGASAVTVAGSAAALLAIDGPGRVSLWAARIESATTTATVAITMGATQGRCICHTYFAAGVRTPDPIGTSVLSLTTSSTASTQTVPQINPGEFVISAISKNASGVTIGYTGGSTLASNTSAGAETGHLTMGITGASSLFAIRTNHSITTTMSSGGSQPQSAIYALIR